VHEDMLAILDSRATIGEFCPPFWHRIVEHHRAHSWLGHSYSSASCHSMSQSTSLATTSGKWIWVSNICLCATQLKRKCCKRISGIIFFKKALLEILDAIVHLIVVRHGYICHLF
jgi:hypothetical protein